MTQQEELEADLAAAKASLEQLTANVHATQGVIQYVESKLQQLKQKESAVVQ